MLVKQTKQGGYLTPEIEVAEIKVEQGFSISNMEPINPEKPEQDW